MSQVFRDERGFVLESFSARAYREAGLAADFVQDNHSRSTKGVLRGLHYQLQHPQGKLVSVVRGSIFDVAVDIRRGSPNFGKWYGAVLDDVSLHALWIPPGFAHGFCTLSETADVTYKCTDYYTPDAQRGIVWSDSSLDIQWPIADPITNAKDRLYPPLRPDAADLPEYDGDR